MFISPALEELTETRRVSITDEPAPFPSALHGTPSVDGDSRADMTAKNSSDMDGFHRDLTRQLVGVDQQTFQKVKQAIQSALNSQRDSTDPSSVIQVIERKRLHTHTLV